MHLSCHYALTYYVWIFQWISLLCIINMSETRKSFKNTQMIILNNIQWVCPLYFRYAKCHNSGRVISGNVWSRMTIYSWGCSCLQSHCLKGWDRRAAVSLNPAQATQPGLSLKTKQDKESLLDNSHIFTESFSSFLMPSQMKQERTFQWCLLRAQVVPVHRSAL